MAEPLRVENVADLTPESLGLRRGITTFGEAKARLAALRATGIVSDAYVREHEVSVEVLAADYQRRVHVFRGGRYDHSVPLQAQGVPAYGIALRLARFGNADLLLVLYRDPLERKQIPPTMLAYQLSNGRYQLWSRSSFESLVSRHGGMTSPMFVGNDLNDGVILVARNREGALWSAGYLLRVEQGRLATQARSMKEIIRCSCVRDYAAGVPSR